MNKDLRDLWSKIEEKADRYPEPDLVTCSDCGQQFKISDCPTEEDGGWETGYHTVPICPSCEDGGCLDDYSYSLEQLKKYEEFENEQKNIS